MSHRLVNLATVAKADFNFGGVHVHIHARGINFDIQRINRLAVAVQYVFIGTARAVAQYLVAHEAAIHVTKLLVAPGARRIGNARAAPDVHGGGARQMAVAGGAVVHLHGLFDEIAAQHVGQALVQRRITRAFTLAPLLHQLALVPDGKTHVRPGQGVAAHSFHAMGQLGGIGLQEFAPRRGAVKQFFHFDCGAHAAGHGNQFTRAPMQRISVGLAASPRVD